jgi:hypothetical protein
MESMYSDTGNYEIIIFEPIEIENHNRIIVGAKRQEVEEP